MTRSGTPSPVKTAPRFGPGRRRLRARLLAVLAPLALLGCGGGWTSIPVESLDAETPTLGSDRARLTLSDGRVFDFRVSRLEYPYLWGERFLGENMPFREMRIDLREVVRIDVPNS